MNDPGLDDNITDAATQAQHTIKSQRDQGGLDVPESEDVSRSMPTRWWYASTAFPLIAGTFGPMANAFSVNALVENWRVSVPPGGTEQHGIDLKDPRWLIAVNSVSLVFALTANMSLLLNMAKRIRFEVAQPITIFGFWFASILLIGLLSFASSSAFDAPGVEDQALTQAFYYAIFAAALYQIISYLMCVTVWGAYKGAYSKNFELTPAQRTLMLQTISFLVYLEIGALVYCKVEGWKFLDAVYFMDFTLLTVGIGGEYTPKTHVGRSLLFPFAVGGIIAIGLVVSSIRSMVLERGAEKMSARMTEKTRRRVIAQVTKIQQRGRPSRKTFHGIGKDAIEGLAKDPADDHIEELERRHAEFQAMRSVQDMASKEQRYLGLTVSTTVFAVLWFVGAAVFWQAEKNQQWTYFASLYFAYTSILTIGYGDLLLMANASKPFFVFWSLMAVPTLTILISSMGDTVVKGVKDATIWLGELSVLPSSEGSTRDRLKQSMHRITNGKLSLVSNIHEKEEDTTYRVQEDEEARGDGLQNMPPGLIKLFKSAEDTHIDPSDIQILDRLAGAWSEEEIEGEHDAMDRDDRRAQAEHHYRHLLISQIPRVYAHTKQKVPKKYTYAEWTFYLRLLGEDEADSTLHRKAVLKSKAKGHYRQGSKQTAGEGDPDMKVKWSWIGQNSPLLQDKDEAEWILERLFERLEESSRQAAIFEKDERDESSTSS
ncbi:hypothetical protein LTS08_000142 [Lithohypha guttulata]|nr:hypothetical protein LTS08_000142 [Lithohypha guttulata]